MQKLFQYRSAGVREYWIVDPSKDRIIIYNFEAGTTAVMAISGSLF
ncbi:MULTISPECIES: Uma2 family endonuclease [Hungatella]